LEKGDFRDVESGKVIKILKGRFEELMCMACSADGKFLLTGNTDGMVDFWDVETGKLKATFASFPDASVVITPAGYFSGSGKFDKYLHFVDGENRVYEICRFKEELYRKLMKSLVESAGEKR
jgi:WD40 repeat protein